MEVQTHADTQMPLRIKAIVDVARDIRSFELVDPDGADLPPFTAGSHVKVQAPNGMVRKYSLCNSPEERHRYVIAVKKEEEGRGGSLSLHQDAKVGATLPISVPENAFPMVENARAYLFVAGGIGITPILSMIRSLGDPPEVPWKLIYLSRHAETTAFREELVSPAFKRRVTIHHNEGDSDEAFDLWPALEKANSAHLYCCGPRPLMEAVRDMTGHWSAKNVHFESFNEGGGVRVDDKPFQVRLAKSQREFTVPVGRSILEVIREHGCNAPSSCESGTCGSCRTDLLEGEVDHRDMVLMPDELSTQIMICVSRAKGERVVIDL